MPINLDFLKSVLINARIPRPISGTLSGHAAGEPFDKHAFGEIKLKYPKITFRQYEYEVLNEWRTLGGRI
jgi:type II restriction enzyme